MVISLVFTPYSLCILVFNPFFPYFSFSFPSSASFSFFYMSKIVNEQAPKRVKVTLACVICRKKKVKCDGIQPSCSRCQSIGNCCQYSDPPKKRGPPKGYVEVIESRAHRIESLLGYQQNKQQQQILIIKKDQPINALLCLISGAVNTIVVHVR